MDLKIVNVEIMLLEIQGIIPRIKMSENDVIPDKNKKVNT